MTCCFARLGARALLPTRLDLVRRLGGVPAAADAGRLALSAAGVTPQFAYGLHPLTPLLLARRLLSGAPTAAPQPASATPPDPRRSGSIVATAMLGVALHRLPGDVATEFLGVERIRGRQEIRLLAAKRLGGLLAHTQRDLVGELRHIGVE